MVVCSIQCGLVTPCGDIDLINTGCTRNCQNDKFRCNQWWQFCPKEDITISGYCVPLKTLIEQKQHEENQILSFIWKKKPANFCEQIKYGNKLFKAVIYKLQKQRMCNDFSSKQMVHCEWHFGVDFMDLTHESYITCYIAIFKTKHCVTTMAII